MRPARPSSDTAIRKARGAFRAAATAVLTLTLTSCDRTPAADPRMVSEWMHTLYGVMRVERMSPPVASRLMGYATTALYAGLASSSDNLPSLSGVLNGIPEFPRATKQRDAD